VLPSKHFILASERILILLFFFFLLSLNRFSTGLAMKILVIRKRRHSHLCDGVLMVLALSMSSKANSIEFSDERNRLSDIDSAESCGPAKPPDIVVFWEQAIASYDPIRDAMWLEFDIRHPAKSTPSCVAHNAGWEARVELDGAIAAVSRSEEAGLEIPAVGLGRHWMSVHLFHPSRLAPPANAVEFVLPWHTHLLILRPRSREPVALRDVAAAGAGARPDVCVRVVCGANTSAAPCVPARAAVVFAIDGAPGPFAPPLPLPDDDFFASAEPLSCPSASHSPPARRTPPRPSPPQPPPPPLRR
jgi:hypothetical protein